MFEKNFSFGVDLDTETDISNERENRKNNSTFSEPSEPEKILLKKKRNKFNNLNQNYQNKLEKLSGYLRIENELIRCFFAEFIGTMVFISFSLGGVAQYVFGKGINFLSVSASFGFGLTMGIIIAGKVSGGHFNPAVSFAFLLLGKLSPIKYIVYVIAQNLGAFVASVMVYLVYLNELTNYEDGMYSLTTSGIFGTLPRNTTSDSGTETFSLFWDQFFASTLFITTILAICDDKNTPSKIPHTIKAVLVGLNLLVISTAFGINCGFAVNPARDFAPRVFTLMAGWGTKVFTAGPYFFWIPIVAPMLGSVAAVIVYYLFIGNHLPGLDSSY